MGSSSAIIRLALGAIGLTVALGATQAQAAHSAGVFNIDHDPFVYPFDSDFIGTVHGNGFTFGDPPGVPLLTPGLSYLNGITGGTNSGASGTVQISDPAQGQVGTIEFLAIAITIRIPSASFHGSLLQSGHASDVVSDLNNPEPGGTQVPSTAYSYDNIPQQYLPEAQYLSAGEAATGGKPFDILEVATFTTPPSPAFGPNLYWLFDFSNEVGNLDSITSLQITDIGVVPEPAITSMLAMIGLTLLEKRRQR